MSNLEIIELQNEIISNMAQINAELHSRLEQYEAVAQNEKNRATGGSDRQYDRTPEGRRHF